LVETLLLKIPASLSSPEIAVLEIDFDAQESGRCGRRRRVDGHGQLDHNIESTLFRHALVYLLLVQILESFFCCRSFPNQLLRD
jgi:hypothetical protein